MQAAKKDIISELRRKILLMQGCSPAVSGGAERIGLGPIEAAFPNGVFPAGAVHEFLNPEPEQAAACGGFIAGILSSLIRHRGPCLWIGTERRLFPPALAAFGIAPDQIIFIDLKREKDVLWATEEALKCDGLAAVVSEVRELSFAQSRRLQLAVEKSQVTGFMLRNNPLKILVTACVARWKITPQKSQLPGDMPGVGHPRWRVELLKVRNGHTGAWQVEWSGNRFIPVLENSPVSEIAAQQLKAV